MAKDNGQTVPTDLERDPAVQAMKIKALEGAVNKLSAVFNKNVQDIRNAFSMVDQHTFVLQRICNDMAHDLAIAHEPGTAPRLVITEDLRVDTAWYHFQYYQAQQLQMFVEFFNSLPSPTVEEKEEQNTEEHVSYFGGDYGETQPAQGS